MSASRALLGVAALLAGCRHPPLIPPAEAQPEVALAQAFTYYGNWPEQVPADVSPDTVVDEARLDVSAWEFCFDVVVRAPRRVDQPLDRYEYECSLDGPDTIGFVRKELEPVTLTHPYKTDDLPGVFTTLAGPLDNHVFHVVERHAVICCPARPTRSLELTLGGRNPALPQQWVRLEWQWTLERAVTPHARSD
jgi:hypothetical protein